MHPPVVVEYRITASRRDACASHWVQSEGLCNTRMWRDGFVRGELESCDARVWRCGIMRRLRMGKRQRLLREAYLLAGVARLFPD